MTAGAHGVPDEAAGEQSGEGPLGRVRQAEASGGEVSWTRFGTGPGLELGAAVAEDRDGHVLTAVLFTGSADLGRDAMDGTFLLVPGMLAGLGAVLARWATIRAVWRRQNRLRRPRRPRRG